MPELDLWLDHYDDIYSDFDSRHYLKRRISDDFLYEVRTSFRHKEGHIDDLVLILPAEKRQEQAEQMIAESLNNYWHRQYESRREAARKKRGVGLLFLFSGMTLMVVNTFISYYYKSESFPLTAVRVLLEPAGWFMIWAAMETLFYELRTIKKEKNFFREISEAKIHFRSA